MKKITAPTDVSKFADELLNDALRISLEWGENLGKPLPPRLQARYTEITGSDADVIAAWCDEAENFAFAVIEKEYLDVMASRPGTAKTQIKAALTRKLTTTACPGCTTRECTTPGTVENGGVGD